jgi:hypothetical protein
LPTVGFCGVSAWESINRKFDLEFPLDLAVLTSKLVWGAEISEGGEDVLDSGDEPEVGDEELVENDMLCVVKVIVA